jgi:hypothetical protein
MIKRIPDEELAARKADRDELLRLIGPLKLDDYLPSQNQHEGGDHA